MEIPLIIILAFISSVIGAMSGFGISTIMIPAMLFFYPFAETLVFVGIVHWFGSLWQLFHFKTGFKWRIFLMFGATGLIASVAGAMLTMNVSPELLSAALGIFLVAYVVFLALKPHFSLPQNSVSMIAGGASSGFFAGVFGIGGPVRSAFLTAFNLEKTTYIVTAAAISIIVDSSRLATYVWNGTRLNKTMIITLLVCVPVSFLATRFAKKIVGKIPQEKFRFFVAAFLLLAAVKFLLFPAAP